MEASSESDEEETREKPPLERKPSETANVTKAIKAKNVMKKKTKSGKKEKKNGKRNKYKKAGEADE